MTRRPNSTGQKVSTPGLLRHRAARLVERHPWWSGSLVGGVIPVVAAALIGWVANLSGLIDTVTAAEKREAALRQEFNEKLGGVANSVAQLAGAVQANSAAEDRTNAGYSSRLAEMLMDRAAVRTDDCKVLDGKMGQFPPEAVAFILRACARFGRDEEAAMRRFEDAQATAAHTWQKR